jgi:glycosyltransferase involved in cell wall biosynthesis
MRLLWVSDSPTTPSGFGGVTREVCRRLARRGHRLEILGWQAYGTTTYWEGIPVHPVRRDRFGADVLLGYLHRLQPHFLLTLADIWWMSFLTEPPVQRYLDLSGTRWVHYYPVDGADPEGRLPAGWVKVLSCADVPVAMSRFGMEVSAACGVPAAYIPHGVDTELFQPPPDKAAAKARLGYEGRFVVLSDARNQPRKLLPRLLDIFAAFARDKPEALLHLHADPEDDAAHSDLYRYNIRQDLEALGLTAQVRFTPGFRMRASGGIPLERLAEIYAAADVHLLTSWGEGFGLPNLQAASAGVVPVALAYTASRELVAGHGCAIPAECGVVDEFGLVRGLMDREAAVSALNALYADPGLLAAKSRQSREFALGYTWDRIAREWERLLTQAPPRRTSGRGRLITWTAGHEPPALGDLPPEVKGAVTETLAPLPPGVRVSLRLAERRAGEVSTQIRQEAFRRGEELSIPVRLPPFFPGAPRPTIGYVLVSPLELSLAVLLKRIFPGVAVAVPRPGGDPESPVLLPPEELLPALAHMCLVIDCSGTGAPDLDLACAALGVPYVGPSALWPPIPLPPVHQVRLLFTDQGFSECRRQEAWQRALVAVGEEALERLRHLALKGQPRRQAAPGPAGPEPELFLVRPSEGQQGPEVARRLREYLARHGGLLLMATAGGSFIVGMPPGGKEVLKSCPLVGFVGGVQLDGQGKAVRALKKHFALNAVRQLLARSGGPPAA